MKTVNGGNFLYFIYIFRFFQNNFETTLLFEMFQYTYTTFKPPVIFFGYFLIQNRNFILFFSSSHQKKVRTVGSFLPQNQSKVANQIGRNQCGGLREGGGGGS